jgi:protein-disulfide isomerase
MGMLAARRAWDKARRGALLAGLLASGLGLAACSAGDGSGLATLAPTGTIGSDSAGATEAETAAKPARFDPFAPAGTPPPGGREVIENPTLAQVLEPGPLPDRVVGRADAPVTLIKYASLTCPHCRRFQLDVFPQLKREYIDTGKVRLIIREFPIGKQSGQATVAWRCATPERQLAVYERFLRQQNRWVSQEVRLEPIAAVAAEAGVSPDALAKCRADKAMIAGLAEIKDRGRKLGIIGTPNFFVQNRLVKTTLDMAGVRALVDPLLAGQPVGTAAR